jgi:hypothetical protein
MRVAADASLRPRPETAAERSTPHNRGVFTSSQDKPRSVETRYVFTRKRI